MTLASAPFVYYITDGVAVVGLVGRRGLQTGTSSDFSMPIFLDEHVPRGRYCRHMLTYALGWYGHACKKICGQFFAHAFCFSILFVLVYKNK